MGSNVLKAAAEQGVDLEANLPQKVLPTGPDTKWPIYWVGNEDDSTVPVTEGDRLLELLRTQPSRYEIKGAWKNSGVCNGVDHCAGHLREFDHYMKNLCSFWLVTFGMSTKKCSYV